MKNLVRVISEDGSVVACAINSTDIVNEIEKIQKSSAVVTAAVGRLATAASIMGYMLKSEDDKLTLRINGGGATGSLIAVADYRGNVKAFVSNPIVEIPLNSVGKLDVAGAVGTDGTLSVIRDLGLKEPYVGQVPLVSGEIAEDITSYYAISEQTPTVCGLGVLVNPDLTVKAAGGYLVQLLPFADEECIDILETNLANMQSVSALIDNGVTPEEICFKLLDGLNPNVLDEGETKYQCDCNKQRIEQALLSMGRKDLTSLLDDPQNVEVACHFCNNKYEFTHDDIRKLLGL